MLHRSGPIQRRRASGEDVPQPAGQGRKVKVPCRVDPVARRKAGRRGRRQARPVRAHTRHPDGPRALRQAGGVAVSHDLRRGVAPDLARSVTRRGQDPPAASLPAESRTTVDDEGAACGRIGDKVEDRGIAGAPQRAVETAGRRGQRGKEGVLDRVKRQDGPARRIRQRPRDRGFARSGTPLIMTMRLAGRAAMAALAAPITPASSPSVAGRTGALYQMPRAGTVARAEKAAAPAPPPITTQSGLQVAIRLSMAARKGVARRRSRRGRKASLRASRSSARVVAGRPASARLRAEGGAGTDGFHTADTATDARATVRINAQVAKLPGRSCPAQHAPAVQDGPADAGADGQHHHVLHALRAPCAASPSRAMVASFSIVTGRPVAASTMAANQGPKVDIAARQDAPRVGMDLTGHANAKGRHAGCPDLHDQIKDALQTTCDQGNWAPCARLDPRRWLFWRRAGGFRRYRSRWPTPCLPHAVCRAITASISRRRARRSSPAALSSPPVQRNAVLPQRPPGNHTRCAIGHRSFNLPQERRMVHPGRQDRPGNLAAHRSDVGAGLRRAG